ncbi:hypothetical protein GE115_09910 [Agromyces sp. CFH 90414]|uniref:2-phosphosulfolactate phosphatase n=1 Tax=Agromyces agglutinans TaxID=2662258 RepID=A0A6I2F6E5_9MICO|nr:hypothetical protein [Agromyces agglutinans]MRG60179.1 hypothetical protein [Agromyces agglutinans]
MTSYPPASQGKYQVRFDQGEAGLARIGEGVDIVVWVDALGGASVVERFAARAAIAGDTSAGDATVLAADLTDAAAVARWILDEQGRLGRRAYLAIVTAADEGLPVSDVLAAGAVVDALMELGIDDTSPEAAVAAAAFTGLRRAVRHLTAASAQGRAAVAEGAPPQDLHRLASLGSVETVRVLREASAR